MILETSWGTPTGWIIVRDALLIGPWHHQEDRSLTYRRTPERLRGRAHPAADHPLRVGRGADDHGLRAGARLRPRSTSAGTTPATSYHQGEARGRRAPTLTLLTTDMRLGFEGGQASARTLLKEGDIRFMALSWGGAVAAGRRRDAYKKQVWTAHHWQHWLARGNVSRPPVAQLPAIRNGTKG